MLGVFSFGVASAADLADTAVAAACCAIFSAVVNYLQMKRVPSAFRKGAFEVALCVEHVPATG